MSSSRLYSIEWQKRGLPHVHLLLWLHDKIRPSDFDKIVSAELPDPQEDPELFELVKKHMIHGPCGSLDPTCPCMKDRHCTKHFPKSFTEHTITGNDGYPQYRRRSPEQGGIQARLSRRSMPIDNRWVVPYNPYLLRTFQCHLNVEICSSVKGVKYICKYINKGQDMAVFGVRDQDRNDEIKCFQAARYISTNEAIWRIFSFSIHDHSPTVQKLHVHLENGQRVYFTPQTAEDQAEEPPHTTLTRFFELCFKDGFARTLLYNELPKYYVWKNKNWKRRERGTPVLNYAGVKQSDAIGRVYTVHPNNRECYHLRLLLHVVRGPTSFQDLKTVDGDVCATYKEACQRRGLLESDAHWDQALAEAALTRMPKHIRDMFAIMLHTCSLSEPLALWQTHKESMSEDFLFHQRRLTENPNFDYTESIFNRALIYLEDKTLSFPNGQVLTEYGLPAPDRSHPASSTDLPREVALEYAYDRDELQQMVDHRTPLLTLDQRTAYDAILQLARDETGSIVFLDAPGGTGKTFLLNLLLAKIRLQGDIAIAVASSGIAATLLSGGKTAHSTFKLPLNLHNTDRPTCNIKRGTARAELLRRAKIIVWDECTMSHKQALEALNRTLQDLQHNELLMGGLLLVLAGDFRQTLPIIERGTRADEISACLKSSKVLWPYVKTFHLEKNMRVHRFHDVRAGQYADLLLRIGDGKIPPNPANGLIKIPCGNLVDTLEKLQDSVFPDVSQNFFDVDWLSEVQF